MGLKHWVEMQAEYATWHVNVKPVDGRVLIQITSGDCFLTRSFPVSEIHKLIDRLSASVLEVDQVEDD